MISFYFRNSPRLLLAIAWSAVPCAPAAGDTLSQPVAAVVPVTDTYFGKKVVDPYRWMEDLKSPKLQAWVKGQAAYAKDYLSKLPGRGALIARVEALDNAATRVTGLQLCGSRYFYMKTNPGDQTPKLYARDGLEAGERLLADPQALGGPGKRYTISGFFPSPDGRWSRSKSRLADRRKECSESWMRPRERLLRIRLIVSGTRR